MPPQGRTTIWLSVSPEEWRAFQRAAEAAGTSASKLISALVRETTKGK